MPVPRILANTICIRHIVTLYAFYSTFLVAFAVYYSPISSVASIASIYVSYSYFFRGLSRPLPPSTGLRIVLYIILP